MSFLGVKTMDKSPVVTTGVITRTLRKQGVPTDLNAVCYAVRALALEPVGRIGGARLFLPDAVESVREFILKKRRQGRPQGVA